MNNKIAIIVSTPVVAKVFLSYQINALVELYDVTLITNFKNDYSLLNDISNKINVIELPIDRDLNLYTDLKSLLILVYIFYKNKFSLVHSVTPKAGLLTAIAAWITITPNRLHTFTGQVWLTKTGIKRQSGLTLLYW